MKINEIETSTNPSISTNIGSKNHWGVKLTSNGENYCLLSPTDNPYQGVLTPQGIKLARVLNYFQMTYFIF